MAHKIWRSISPYWHVLTFIASTIIACVIWVNDVSSYGGRILTLEEHRRRDNERLIRMDYNVQMIARKVGLKPLERPDDGSH